MGWLCDRVVEAGGYAIADFICPIPETREAFGAAFTVWVDRIKAGRYADTNALFVPPEAYGLRVTQEGAPEVWAERVLEKLQPAFDPRRPAALFIGSFWPFHDSHRRRIEEAIRRAGQVLIAVRNDGGEPSSFIEVKQRLEAALASHSGRYMVTQLPNITRLFYDRGEVQAMECVQLDQPDASLSVPAPGLEALSGIPCLEENV